MESCEEPKKLSYIPVECGLKVHLKVNPTVNWSRAENFVVVIRMVTAFSSALVKFSFLFSYYSFFQLSLKSTIIVVRTLNTSFLSLNGEITSLKLPGFNAFHLNKFSLIIFCTVLQPLSQRRLWNTDKSFFSCLAKSISASASLLVIVKGLSTTTCLPASSASWARE